MRRRAVTERGFTLIEIVVVMLIIAALAAIAIPTFLSQKSNALESQVTKNITIVRDAMEACASNTSDGNYVGQDGALVVNCAEATTLEGYEKSVRQLRIQPGPPAATPEGEGTTQVQLTPSGQGYIVQRVINDSGTFVYFAEIHTDAGGLVRLCSARTPLEVGSVAGAPDSSTKSCKGGTWRGSSS